MKILKYLFVPLVVVLTCYFVSQPVTHFLKKQANQNMDVLIFSSDKPLQLYACLESLEKYSQNYQGITVVYATSNEEYASAYEKIKAHFQSVRFLGSYEEFTSSAEYIALVDQEAVVKEPVTFKNCKRIDLPALLQELTPH